MDFHMMIIDVVSVKASVSWSIVLAILLLVLIVIIYFASKQPPPDSSSGNIPRTGVELESLIERARDSVNETPSQSH
ncbi:hypothetical protein KJ765_02275 [Candidatus Micrarchaeota archaeon]|nr:hypothetical protein [Candidatus Micrarchaeota archaeon]